MNRRAVDLYRAKTYLPLHRDNNLASAEEFVSKILQAVISIKENCAADGEEISEIAVPLFRYQGGRRFEFFFIFKFENNQLSLESLVQFQAYVRSFVKSINSVWN